MAKRPPRAPEIQDCRWGVIRVAGVGTLKDAKLWPGGARAWDWNETGTQHVPGIQPADVTELLAHGATTIVLSQGMLGMLQVRPETLRGLEERQVRALVLPTPEAVEAYNRLVADGVPVGALIHSTC